VSARRRAGAALLLATILACAAALPVAAGVGQVSAAIQQALTQLGVTPNWVYNLSSVAHVESNVAYVVIAAEDYTDEAPLVTIQPAGNTTLEDVEITFDLDAGDGAAGYHAVQITGNVRFLAGKKIQGTWRSDASEAAGRISSTLNGTDAHLRSLTVRLGRVTPTEGARVFVRLSVEHGDFTLPYICTYRAPTPATFASVH
jgi:hypothetical protein